MPPKQRVAVSLDDAEIDFSRATNANTGTTGSSTTNGGAAFSTVAAALSPAELLRQAAGGGVAVSGSDSATQRDDTLERAFDPALSAYVQRRAIAGAGRRRMTFGGPASIVAQPTAPPSTAAAAAAAAAEEDTVNRDTVRRQQTSAAAAFLTSSMVALQEAAAAAEKAQEDQRSMANALAARKEAYVRDLCSFCQQGLPWATVTAGKEMKTATTAVPDTAASGGDRSRSLRPFPAGALAEGQTNSLLCGLFTDGVPDIEPWDRWAFALPRYDPNALLIKPNQPATQEGVCDLVHHPLLPDSHYTQHYQHAHAQQPVVQTLYKTRDELRAERQERLRKKQEEKRRAVAAAKKEGDVDITSAMDGSGRLVVSRNPSSVGTGEHDRLSNRTLVHGLLGRSVLNPIAADNKIHDEYQQRFLGHQRRNHDRHVAALPNQIMKRDRDTERHARERPVLRAYRVYPIYSQAHLGKLRNFANDSRLRGFILWVGQCDACVVLSGGEVAVRHLDRWLLHKMKWESTETQATRLCSVPLQDSESFSFHLKRLVHAMPTHGDTGASTVIREGPKRRRDGDDDKDADQIGKEPVFINQCATAAEAEAFLRGLPVNSPWENLAGVWRSAFLADGLSR